MVAVSAALLLLGATLQGALASGAELYVAPNGKDTSSGSKRRPFATLTKARDAVRELKAKKGLPEGGVTIHLRAGEYNLPETFTLTPQDSGTAEAPITYAAYQDEDARVVSKRAITGWKLLAAPWPAGLPAAAQGKVYAADIPKGWRFHFLYMNDVSQPVAKSTQSDVWRQWKRLLGSDAPGTDGRRLKFPADQSLADIPSNGDAELTLITAQWWNIVAPITGVDPAAKTAMLQSRCTVMYRNILDWWGGFYNLRNALPVLDEAGEWVVDSANGRVYYWPADGTMDGKTAFAPVLHELVRLQGDEEEQGWAKQVEHVTITGLRFMYTDRTPENEYDPKWLTRNGENPDAMIYFQGVRHCTFDHNVIAYSGSQGLALDHYAQNITVTRNEIAYSSSGGILITGYGPGEVDVNKHHLIERNYIHHLGLDYMHSCGLTIYGSHGNIVRLNHFADLPYSCVQIVGMPARYMNDPGLVDTTDAYGNNHSMYQARWTELEKHRPLDNTSMRPFLHSGNNQVVRNICDRFMLKLEDGGCLHTWQSGTHNVWVGNVGERTYVGPGISCILYPDDDTAFNTYESNTFWTPGPAIHNNSHNDTNIFKDNEISPDKPARYDAARQAILDEIRAKGIWRTLPPSDSGSDSTRDEVER